jgi:hypothetical protein
LIISHPHGFSSSISFTPIQRRKGHPLDFTSAPTTNQKSSFNISIGATSIYTKRERPYREMC